VQRPIWLSRWGPGAAYGAAAVVGAWAAARLLGGDTTFPMVQLMAFTPYVAVAAGLLAVALWALRQWWPAAAISVLASALITVVVPRALADANASAGARGPTLRVATANLFVGAAEPAALLESVVHLRIDVLAVQEMNPAWLSGAESAGLTRVFPFRSAIAVEGTQGSGLFSRYPLEATGAHQPVDGWFYQAYAVIRLPDGSAVRVESAHVASPYERRVTPDWVLALRREPRADPASAVPRILMGDFNATLDHSELRKLISSGYRDAASVAGQGWIGTWGPYDGDPIPPVIIDHILADRRIGVKGVYVHAVEGSDHRMVVADLVLPKR